jgi:PASTA domain-containing protein/IPT/TIG domain-containing protein
MFKFRLIAALAISICAVAAAPAGAALVTVGSSMTSNYTSTEIGSSFAVFNTKVSGNSVSPVSGAVIGWNIQGASGGPFTLRVIEPINSTEYLGGGASAGVSPLTTAFQHFSTHIPIKAGDTIAFDHANVSDHIGVGTPLVSGDKLEFFTSPLPEGARESVSPSGAALEAAFNAEVQPTPAVTALGTTSGPTSGGTSVLIAGTDLENTTGVSFGGTPASFTPSSEGSVLATSPPSASAGAVAVTVTTLAGNSTASQTFAYQAPSGSNTGPTAGKPASKCKVPSLVGKRLRTAKSKLKAAGCTLGKVTRRKASAKKVGRVLAQGSKPGASLRAGAAVKLTVGKPA